MTFEIWLLYLGTVLLFMVTPGPSHLLMLSTSMSNGFRRSLATAAGDLSANVLQILLAGLGLAVVITASAYGFTVVKWAGVGYLVWLGIRQILNSMHRHDNAAARQAENLGALYFRGFVTSAANPKAVVFFAALFPQFLNAELPLGPQIFVLGLTYIIVDACFLSAYGGAASWLANRLSGRGRQLVDRIAGSSLIIAAILLGLRSNSR